MNDTTLSQFIATVFLPYLPFIAGGVISFILITMFLIMFRGFMPKEK
jgi:L-lactate permease